jgi:hypothetical protein
VGQVTYLWTVCLYAVIFSFSLFSVSLTVFNLHGAVWIVNCESYYPSWCFLSLVDQS